MVATGQVFVVLLRGVNVGKGRRVPMARLREVLAELGYTGVATLLNSGNAVFRSHGGTAKQHAERIAAALLLELDIEVPVIVKSARELSVIVESNPITATGVDHSRMLVAFTQEKRALKDLVDIESVVKPPEQFEVGAQAAYLHCVNGILQSKAGEALLGRKGAKVTTRNLATTLKLLALARGA